jgi:glycosyltransferase involved in cell wall biosynthesis
MARHLTRPDGPKRLAKGMVLPALRAIRSRGWQLPLPVESISPGPVVVTGFQNEVMGLGRGAILLEDALRRVGLDPIRHSIRQLLDHFPAGGLRLPAPDGGVWFVVANAEECDACLQALRPQDFASRYRIAYWAWETTIAPASWTKTAHWFHEIWVPSRFVANAIAARFAESGQAQLQSRLRVQPHPNPRLAASPDRRRFNAPDDALVALTMFDGRSSFARKNPEGAVRAWIMAFPEPRPDALLWIKTLPETIKQRQWSALARQISDRPDIRPITERLDPAEMGTLIASVDLLISLHRSEGFGLPIFEALSLGKAVLATNYSAPSEFISEDAAFFVPAKETPVSDPSGTYVSGFWGEPDLDKASNLLREFAQNAEFRATQSSDRRRVGERLDSYWARGKIDANPWWRLVADTRTCQ